MTKNDTDAFRCRYHFLLSSKLRDSNKEGAYEVCGRKCFGEAFSPTWQRAKRGDRCGSTGTKSLALMPNQVPLLIQSYRWWYCYFIVVKPCGIRGYKNKRCSYGFDSVCNAFDFFHLIRLIPHRAAVRHERAICTL